MRAGRGWLAGLAVASCLMPAPVSARQAPRGELLERTLAIVGGAVITQSDAGLAEVLALLDGGPVPEGGGLLARLVDRWLMRHEVERFAPGEPAAAAIEARLSAIRSRAGGPEAVAQALARAGRTAEDLAAWARDDLWIAAYLESRFASAGAPVDADVAAWVQAHADDLARAGAGPVEATRQAREELARARRAELVTDWLADLRRRVEVVTFPDPGPH